MIIFCKCTKHNPNHILFLMKSDLMWRSFKDAGTLVNSLCPQPDFIILQFLCSSVQGLRHQATLWDFTLHIFHSATS